MDIDRFVARHQSAWHRLGELSAPRRRRRRLSPAELDELLTLYQRVSGHLSYARTELGDPTLVARLTNLVATANGVVYGTPARRRGRVRGAVTVGFPGAVWRIRWFVLAAALLTLVPAVVIGVWIGNSPAALDASAPAAVREAYVNEDFASYYSSKPAVQFATEVFTNNVRVAMLAFAAGVLVCVLTGWILVQNGANVGLAGGLFAAAGQQPKFWGLILPHGLIELSAVIIAGAAGLRIGWTIIDPGDRLRGRALVEEGRGAVAVVLGLVPVFGVAGLIEGFITGRGLPTLARVGVGVVVCTVFWTYVMVLGRLADGARVEGRAADRHGALA
jgi:uncharacterized membrane protein SpoIIM required for sporulation